MIKRSYCFVLLFLLSFLLMSCKNDNHYLDKNIIVNELNTYVADVLVTEHLASFIEENYSNLSLTEDIYSEALINAKEALFNLEKETLISLFSLADDYFDNIDDINLLYPYAAINNMELINIKYNFNPNQLNENYVISLNDNNPYYLFNSDFELLTSNLLIDEAVLSDLGKTDNKYQIYIVSKTYTYKITLTEVIDGRPYVINPNIYSDFSSDVVIMVETQEGILSVGDNLDSNYYQIINNKIIIDKAYLSEIFTEDRESFVFGINIYLNKTYYLETVHIYKLI